MIDLQPLVDDRYDDVLNGIIKETVGGAGWWMRPKWLRYELARRPDLVNYSMVGLVDDRPIGTYLLTLDPVTRYLQIGDHYTTIGMYTAKDIKDYLEIFAAGIRSSMLAIPEWTHVRVGAPVSDGSAERVVVTAMLTGCAGQPYAKTIVPLVEKDLETPLPDAELLRVMRKSYRQELKKRDRYDVRVDTSSEAMEIAHMLHVEQAGRETRPVLTWLMQQRWVDDGEAFWVIAAHPTTGDPVAFAYILHWHDYAVYFSSATREPDAPKHVQWCAMRALRDRGVQMYELGDIGRAQSKKEQGIEFFKQGFGGEVSPVPIALIPRSLSEEADAKETVQ